MQIRTTHLAVFSAVLLSLAFTPGLADAKGNKGGNKNYDHGEGYHDGVGDFDLDVNIHIGGGDREVIERYIRSDVRRNCPPGLAKKNPPCIPPGHAKKWRKGYSLP